MAITVTKHTIIDGERNVVVHAHLDSDAAADVANQVLISKADYSGSFEDLKITRIDAGMVGFALMLSWDATANVDSFHLADTDSNYDFTKFGGLVNNAGAGKTGDILFSTSGAAGGEHASLIITMRKRG